MGIGIMGETPLVLKTGSKSGTLNMVDCCKFRPYMMTTGKKMRSRQYIDEVILMRDRVENWDVYPYSVPSIRNLDRLSLAQPVTFFFGDNASGKTTLLEAIARLSGLNLEGGSRRHSFSNTGRTSQLAEAIRLHGGGITMSRGNAFFYRADLFSHFMRSISSLDLTTLSRGEAFHTLVDSNFNESGLYLLDEPEVALPPLQQLAFLRILHELVEKGSQLVIVSHSPILLAYPGAVLYELSETGIRQNDYESTDHYRTMHAFMLNREKVLHDLLTQ